MTSPHKIKFWPLICIAIALVAAGCSSSKSSTNGSNGTANDKPLVVAVSVEPDSLDACDTQTIKNGIITHRNVAEALTGLDPETKAVQPLLALSWQQQDPKTWIFKLRPNVKFQDGTAFDASAAAFGITRTADAKLACLNAEEFSGTFTATAVDPLTLKIVTEKPDPILPLRLSFVDLPSPKTPANAKAEAVGTGPFKIVSWNRGQDITVQRFSGYWGAKPQTSGAKYIFRTEDSVRAATAKTGEASIAIPVSVQDSTNNDRTESYTTSAVFFLRTQTSKAPFNDVRVRQAVAYAIDKQTIVSKLMAGFAKPTDQIVVSSSNGYVPGYQGPTFDQAKAKSLIADAKAAGVAVDTQIEFVTRALFPGSDEVIQAIASNLQQVGLNVKISSVDSALWLKFLHAPFPANQQVNIVATLHDNATGDAGFTFPKYIASTGCCSTLNDPPVDNEVAQGNSAQGAQRSTLFQTAAKTAYEKDANLIPIAEVYNNLIIAPGIQYKTNGLTSTELLLSDITRTK
jgi:peptide/nickel transport system substrate-binding protein